MIILGIETSCDETGVAVVKDGAEVLSHVVASSLDMHVLTGGVVPEVASREQVRVILPTLREALHSDEYERRVRVESLETGDDRQKTAINVSDIDAIAVTEGPGLVGPLLVGVETAKALAYAWGKPLIPVNHMLGHIYGAWLSYGEQMNKRWPKLVLLVSGGHSELVLMESHEVYYKIGQTLDDAAGEAFDKVAKLLGLPYPGGPSLSKLAMTGDPKAIKFPLPMPGKTNFDFSFSGLKTAVLHYTKDYPQANKADIAASFEETVVSSLVSKTKRAAEYYKVSEIVLGGGVAANRRLRLELEEKLYPLPVMIPEMAYTTDNGAVIAAAAFYHNKPADWREVQADPSLELPEKR